MNSLNYVLGIDYGTDTVRTLIVDAGSGEEIATSVIDYPRWKDGKYCNPAINQFRQHPLDYLEGLEISVKKALEKVSEEVKLNIKGISIDTTGSTIVAVDKDGVPLSLKSDFEENPNAMFVLWKDHTAVKEADKINELVKNWGGIDYTMYEGSVYSSEWFWAKLLHIIRNDKNVAKEAFSWVEHCDWITAVLTGMTDPLKIKRSRCAAGHKAMWHEAFGGLPDEKFLIKLDPRLKGIKERLYKDTYTSEVVAGTLTEEWANKLGLPAGIKIGVGAFDAHMGAVGGQIKNYTLSKVMGTSTCDMLVAPFDKVGNKLIKGICGQVDGSIIPGTLGMEAGQSAFGDIYAWFKDLLSWPIENIISQAGEIDGKTKNDLINQTIDRIIPELTKEAEKIEIGESGIVAIDWMNGRRTPDANQNLKGAITGLNLGSNAPKIFRALVEATAFGSKRIVDRFVTEGVKINSVIALGGVAKKSPFVMQVMADVLNMDIKVAKSEQTCALGAAMFAAVVAGIYNTVEEAQKAMGSGFDMEYKPVKQNAEKYQKLYEKYIKIGDFIEKETSEN